VRLVIALGGNALLQRGEKPDASVQVAHVTAVSAALARAASEHEVLLCHGNGPQVGLLSLESETDTSLTRPYPLDVLGAQTQGMIGYWLAQGIRNAEPRSKSTVVTVITQTVVAADDPGFSTPTKFVGRGYTCTEAKGLAAVHGWQVARDGNRWRRVVPSPEPQDIVELPAISSLLHAGATVICGGGGGAAVTRDESGRLHGVDAVVDKDLTAAWLAVALHADRLIILTDIEAVMADFGKPDAHPIDHLTIAEIKASSYPVGSMGPKVDACARYVEATGKSASIGSLTDAAAVITGATGTVISNEPSPQPAAPSTPAAPLHSLSA
jgi:carbamate kinase